MFGKNTLYSREVSDWVKANNRPIPLTAFHKLEFTNAINLKRFKKEMDPSQADLVLDRFREHENQGIVFVPPTNWPDIFACAVDLSADFTRSIGSRSLDIIHVASALSWKVKCFYTFDIQ